MAAWFGRKRDFEEDIADRDETPTGEISVAAIAAAGDDADVQRLRADRDTLIRLCLYALDRARSGGVVERIEEGLAELGVVAMRPDGQRFDPALHEAGGTVPTTNDQLDGVVAETEVVGFSDNGTVLRAPIVTVYATGEGGRS